MSSIATTADLIRTQAKERGAAPALSFRDRTMTYADLDDRSSRVAQALLAEGVRPQDRVAFLDKNTPEHFEVLFGCAKTNSVIVPVNWRLAPREVAFIVNDAAAAVLVVGEELVPLVEKVEDQLETVRKVVVLGHHPRHEGYEDWVGRHPAVDPVLPGARSDVALQMYTSGTTGMPKGVMLTNDNLWSIVPITESWGITPESVSLVCMPLFHMAGTGWSLPAMYQGCHVVLLREPDPAAILAAIPRHRVTEALFVPALMQFLLATPGCASTDFSSLRAIFYGASPIADDVLVRCIEVFGCRFMQLYGLTESTGLATALPAADHDLDGAHPERRRSVGVPAAGIDVRIVEPETGRDQPSGAVGEIWIRSRGVMKGYWSQPEETARVITPDGWLRSGDAAYRDDDGYIYIYDRVKDMIVSGGENVYPAEVENVLHGHPAVADVAVIGVPDARWGETVKAIVVLAPATHVSEEELTAFARERLAHYKCPTSVDFVEALPRNPSGKILKRELREPYWADHERRVR